MTLRNFARLATGMGLITVAPKVLENYQVAIRTQGPYHPEGTSRIDAILATNHYKAGQVGFGVSGCIKMIYIGLRGFGEAEIGKVFCHKRVQDMLSNPSGLMLLADWLGRQILYPQEIPAGLVASLIGGIYLIWGLRRL